VAVGCNGRLIDRQRKGADVDLDSENTRTQRQFKTLVLTDLCESVMLVERVGDAAAASLFRRLDTQVLQLLNRWNGRLIDRSDGMFLLFDAPVDGLGFALDYVDELDALGRELKLPLQARIGVHVGYVLSWNNSEEAVAAGAKALEVEGLAKPVAARLMALARPGQILMSSAAESMLRSGQRELPDRGVGLQWKSHGRWRFKGLPAAQEVFEVGRPERAPLRRPAGSSKARRELPLWRRPAALVTEVAVVAVLLITAWVMVRPEPAIAFAERDWVVVGDFANMTGNDVLDSALQQALRISLEQSRHVNVVSDLKVQDTLRQMRKSPGERLDPQTANEVAIRDGARAVIMPTVLEVHGRLRISLDVIDPVSGRVVYSEHADGRGLESALDSIDKVAGSLRLRLGETMAELSKRSLPLPQVATASLDALHAYALGLEAYADNRRDEAQGYFEQAVRLDTAFAAAYMAQMRIAYAYGDFIRARALLAQAARYRDGLTPRDGLYLDAWVSELNAAAAQERAYKWKLLGDLYPDYHAAHANRSNALFTLGRYAEAEEEARKAVATQNPLRPWALRQLARTLLAQNKVAEAEQTFLEAKAQGEGAPDSELAAVMAVNDDYAGAHALLKRIPEDQPPAWLQRIAVSVDEGSLEQAIAQSKQAAGLCKVEGYVCSVFELQQLALQSEAGKAAVPNAFEQNLQRLHGQALIAEGADRTEWEFMAVTSLYLAQRAGYRQLVSAWLPRLNHMAEGAADPRVLQLLQVIAAGEEADENRAEHAVARLKGQVDGTELLQVRVALWKLYEQLGNAPLAERERQWLARQRGLAYSENAGTYALKARNVADVRLARLH